MEEQATETVTPALIVTRESPGEFNTKKWFKLETGHFFPLSDFSVDETDADHWTQTQLLQVYTARSDAECNQLNLPVEDERVRDQIRWDETPTDVQQAFVDQMRMISEAIPLLSTYSDVD